MHNTVLQRVKQFRNAKMIKLEKMKQEKCHIPLLSRPAPGPYFHPFLIFQIPPLRERQSKLTPLPLKGRGIRTILCSSYPKNYILVCIASRFPKVTQFNEGMGHKRIREMFENTRNLVKKLETLRNNEHEWNPVKYANVLHHNRTEKQFLLSP